MDALRQYSIPYKGLSEGKHHYDFKSGDEFFRGFENSEMTGGSADIGVELTKSATMLSLDFTINALVEVPCDRCLGDCEIPVHYAGSLQVRFGDEQEESDGEIMWISSAAANVNVAQYIYESIMLSLPYQRIHRDGADGKPGCDPDMLERFKVISEEELHEIEQNADMRKMAENPEWKKLLDLKDKL